MAQLSDGLKGRCRVITGGAGVIGCSLVEALARSGVRVAILDLNFIGTLLPSMIFTRDMIESKGGVVVNISSMNSFRPLTKIPAYSGV